MHDITERLRREQDFEMLFEAAPLPTLLISGDGPGATVAMANQLALRQFGFGKDSLGRQRVDEVFADARQRQGLMEALRRDMTATRLSSSIAWGATWAWWRRPLCHCRFSLE